MKYYSSGEQRRLCTYPKLIGVECEEVDYDENDVGTFEDLKKNITSKLAEYVNDEWQIYMDEKNASVKIFHQIPDPRLVFKTDKTIVINSSKSISAFYEGKKLKINKSIRRSASSSAIITKWSDLKTVFDSFEKDMSFDENDFILQAIKNLDSIQSDSKEVNRKIPILKDQLKHLIRKDEYATETILLASQLRSISSAAYESLRKYFTLPSHTSLLRYEKNEKNSNIDDNRSHITAISQHLKPEEKLITLRIDESYVKSDANFKVDADCSNSNFDSMTGKPYCGFVIESVHGSMKEMVENWSIAGIKGAQLRDKTLDIINFLQEIGFTVLCILANDNRLNQSLFQLLTAGDNCETKKSFPNPKDENLRIFVKFNSVHIFKNIRNDWLGLSTRTILYPEFENPTTNVLQSANFSEIRALYRNQLNHTVKSAFKLNYKSLFPSSSDDLQSVDLVDNIFHDSTIAAMYNDGNCATADFMQIVKKWWNIHDDTKKPFDSDNDERLDWLLKFVRWIDCLMESSPKNQTFTKDTYEAMRQSTLVTIELLKYLSREYPSNYILTGKIS